jgi:hypothetical protein
VRTSLKHKENKVATKHHLRNLQRSAGAVAVVLVFIAFFTSQIAFPQPPALKEVGSSIKDSCAKFNVVKFNDVKKLEVRVLANESKLIQVSGVPRKDLTWFCGDAREQVKSTAAFTWVRCERATNGAITWTFYTKQQ